MNNKLKHLFIALPLTVLSTTAAANWSTTITAASDYTFNGVTQTDNDPALQADRKSTRLNSSHANESRMPSSA